MAYHAIVSTNDFRGISDIGEEQIKLLCAAENKFYEKQQKPLIEKTKNTPNFMFYLCGFAGEQFKFQQPYKALDNAGRELYILFEIAPKLGFNQIADIVYSETGVTWRALVGSLFLLWLAYSHGNNDETVRNLTRWDEELTVDDF